MNKGNSPTWPNVPSGEMIEDSGLAKTNWRSYFSNTSEQLIGYLTPNGYFLPKLSATQIAALDGSKYVGVILYNTTTGLAMVNNGGTFLTIATV